MEQPGMQPIAGGVISAVCSALAGTFAQTPVYKGEVRQDAQAPCFFVRTGKVTAEQESGSFYHTDIEVKITYVPGLEQGEEECAAKAEQMRLVLEEAVFQGRTYRTSGHQHQMDGRSLAYTLKCRQYYLRIEEPAQQTMMQRMQVHNKTK